MYKQKISFFLFVLALLLLNQVSFATRSGSSYRQTRPVGKRGSTHGRFLKVCNNCRLSPEQIFLFLSFYHFLFSFILSALVE